MRRERERETGGREATATGGHGRSGSGKQQGLRSSTNDTPRPPGTFQRPRPGENVGG